MQKVTLGRTGLEVGVAGLGCGGHSRLGMRTGHDEAHAVRIVEKALDLGIDFIDTARAYRTETAVGKAIRGKRDQVVLSTKALFPRVDPASGAQDLRKSIEKSLRRLGTETIDIFHLHGVTPDQYDASVEVLLPELERQREAGKIRFLGITEYFNKDPSHQMLQRALQDDHFDVVMVGFSLLNPSARQSVFPATREHDVGTLIMFAVRKALSQPEALHGIVAKLLDDDRITADLIDTDDPLGFLASHPEVSSTIQAAYRYCRHQPGAHVVLTGTSSEEHLEENVASILAPALPEELLDRLHRIFGGVDHVTGE